VIARRAMLLRRGIRMAAVAIAALLVPASPSTTVARAEVANRIVATIDGDPITAHQVRRYAKEHHIEDAADDNVLDALVTDQLLEKEIAAQGIAARDDEIDRYIEQIRERNGMDADRFEQALSGQGITKDEYRARVKGEIEKAQLVNREIRQRVNVSPEEIHRYYDAHQNDYAIAERVKVRDILFALDAGADDAEVARVKAKADEVHDLAVKSGRDFDALARQFSEGPGADKGGELGTFSRGEMEAALEQVVFTLKPGQVSDPVRARGGFHVLRVDERVQSGHRPLGEVSDDIRSSLYNDALETRFQQWLSKDLRERHHVEVFN
jgi:parvulin-like peptidyl-prolyl isomerase